MDKNNIYYGTSKRDSLTYLEFGSLDFEGAKKTVWAYWQDQEAYDLYMFARYARDLFLFRDFFKEENKNIQILHKYVKKSAHDKLIDYIFKYAGIRTVLENDSISKSVCESGSSLWGFIEEVQAVDYAINEGKNVKDIESIQWLSSDISDMMLRGGVDLHPNCKFLTSNAPTIAELMNDYCDIGLFYGLSVSLRYALRTSDDLVKLANNAKLSIFNRVSMSFSDDKEIIVGTGKHGYVISISDFIKSCKSNNIYAFYTTENMQKNRDGDESIRISMVFSKDKNIVDDFIVKYDGYIDKVIESELFEYEHGNWFPIDNLIKERDK